MRRELEPADRELLQNITVFNRQYAVSGWQIDDREVKEDLSGVWLTNSAIVACDFAFTVVRSARITATRFDGIEFQHADFSQTLIRDTVFNNCRFLVCRMQGTTLINCRFNNCTYDHLDAAGAAFEGCRFESLEDSMGSFPNVALKQCEFERSRLDGAALHNAQIHSVVFRSSSLKDMVFDAIQGSGLAFENSALDGIGLVDSHYGALIIDGGMNRAVKFKRFDSGSVSLKNIGRMEGFSIRDSAWRETSLDNCSEVVEWTINESEMTNFKMSRSQIAYLDMQNSTFEGASQIDSCLVAALNVSGAKFIGTAWRNCRIVGYLILNDATFDRTVTAGMLYSLETLENRGVSRLNGAGVLGG